MKVSRQIIRRITSALLAAACCALASGCAADRQSNTEPSAQKTPTTEASGTPAQTQPSPGTPEISTAELRDCINRVYRDAVVVDDSRPDNYVTGDFNGDGSQDIAVVVRPGKGKLPDLNDELANWILKDPHEAQLPVAGKQVQPPAKKNARVKVQQNDLLLAIIHGHTNEGWRSPTATQTYLLKNAVGSDLKLWPRAEAIGANRVRSTDIFGDVIGETLAQESGFLYWTGAEYGWQH